jgi:hypothetical protein
LRLPTAKIVNVVKIELTYHEEFFNIALDNYRQIERLNSEIDQRIKNSGKRPYEDEVILWIAQTNDAIGRLALIVIMFSALSLEAYINYYGITRLSKGYFENHLDRLDVFSKWIIIPRVVTGKQLDAGSKALQDLAWLITTRNRFVHYKSRVVEVEDTKETDFLWYSDAEKAITTVSDVLRDLQEIDGEVDRGWPKFAKTTG